MEELAHNKFSGQVKYKKEILFTKTVFADGIVDTVAAQAEHELNKIKELHPDNLVIKIECLPFAHIEGGIKPVSRSHHGRLSKTVYIS